MHHLSKKFPRRLQYYAPLKLVGDVTALLEPASRTEVAAFSLTFFAFSLAVYSFVVSMARLHEGPAQQDATQRNTEPL